jgi:hypothetical protein
LHRQDLPFLILAAIQMAPEDGGSSVSRMMWLPTG